MQRILIIGKSFSGLTQFLKDNGYEYIVLKDVLGAKFLDKKLKRRVLCDFSSREAVQETVGKITQPIDGVIAVYENYVLPAAWAAEQLGLPGMPVAAAEACTDKWLMRLAFAKAPEKISPAFSLINNEQELRDFAAHHDFPLMLKPANLMKSLLITKSHNLEELLENYRKTCEQIGAVYQKYAPNRQPTLLVEEFLHGSAHSVDAFIDAAGEPQVLEEVIDYQTGYDIGHQDNFTYSRILPSALSADDQKALRHCVALGIKALGMQSSPAHAEVIMTPNGPRIIEIGARNGGYRERIHKLANDLDLPRLALDLVLGKKPVINATKNESCAVLELFPKSAGNFKELHNEEALRALPSLNYLSIKPKPGQHVGKASEGYKMCAVVILHHADPAQFARDLEFVNSQVYVEMN